MLRRLLLLVSIVPAIGCGGSEPPSSETAALTEERAPERDDEPGSTRASREAREASTTTTHDTAIGGSTTVAIDRPLLAITASDAATGEDGQGASIPATRAVAFDLDARRFPPRASDPVLFVGALRFTRYEHPRPGVLRFVAADRGLLQDGAEVAVQYGDDASTRVIVSPSLALPEAP